MPLTLDVECDWCGLALGDPMLTIGSILHLADGQGWRIPMNDKDQVRGYYCPSCWEKRKEQGSE